MSELIDREAVIDLLKKMRKDGDMVPWEGKDVFARIRKLPTIQPEERTEKRTETHGVCLDAISRKPAIDALDKQIKQCCKALGSLSLSDVDKHAVEVEMASLRAYRGMLENLPTVQPEPQWISVTERLPDNADHPGAFCPRYQVVTPYGVTEGWYRPHDHEKGGQWFALFWFMSQIYEIWNIDFERGDVPKVIREAPVMEWRPLPEPYKPNNK